MSRHRFSMTFGATLLDDDAGVRFRFYAPSASGAALSVNVSNEARERTMEPLGDGWFELVVPEARAGTRYCFRVGEKLVPDPAARYAPEGVYHASEVIDPLAFDWPDSPPRRPWHEQVVYELHVGTFTAEGTYASATARLDALVSLGVTAIELMPIAQAPGDRTWGYDGVLPFAPSHVYGRPEEFKAFVAAAQARGLAVLLDVVYNHFGPEGNFLYDYGRSFYTDDYHTPWGSAIAFRGDEHADVRRFFIENALYWLREYRLDGLRFDAVHEVYDGPDRAFMRELEGRVRAEFDRHVFLILENGSNEASLLEAGYDAQWVDDIHNALHVALTGQIDGYYADYKDEPVALLGRALAHGFSYQGEPSANQGGTPRGEPSHQLRLSKFMSFLQDHDQVGNRPFGDRITAQAEHGAVCAGIAIVLLAPAVPMLFMGEEWGAGTPFLYFCDYESDLAEKITAGRRNEFASFEGFGDEAVRDRIPDPVDPATFAKSKLRWEEREREPHAGWLAFYKHLLALRREHIVPRTDTIRGLDATYETIGERGLHVRWNFEDAALHLEANLGSEPLAGFGDMPPARSLFTTHGDLYAGGIAPPWSVRWSLT